MPMRLTLPDITCDQWLATIRDVLAPIDGVRFHFGDPGRRTVAVHLNAGRATDEVSVALESAGYPLEAALTPRQREGHDATGPPAASKIERSEAVPT